MKQFYETYRDDEKLSTLCREISWSHQRLIMACRTPEEIAFYVHLTVKERWSYRELERQINSSYFERVMLGNTKLAPVLRELPQETINSFKDSYVLELLHLPEDHKEKDLRKAITQKKHHQIFTRVWARFCLYGRRIPFASRQPRFCY